MSSTCSSCSVIGTSECTLLIHFEDIYNQEKMRTGLIKHHKRFI